MASRISDFAYPAQGSGTPNERPACCLRFKKLPAVALGFGVPRAFIVGRFLKAANDPREVVADAHAPYFGLELDDQSLVPGDNPRIGATRFDDWLGQSTRQK